MLIGHRGAPVLAKENTLGSFAKALEALDGIELDVHRSRDGVLVVYHDFELHGHPIQTLDYADIGRIDPDVPSLNDVLELLEQFPNTRLNLELKSQPPDSDGREEAVAKALQAWPHHSRVWVSSFDPLALIRLQKAGLPCPTALLYAHPEMLDLLPCLRVDAVHPHWSLLSPQKITEFHQLDLRVYTWTVNDLQLARQLLGWGVDGIIGDDPALLLASMS